MEITEILEKIRTNDTGVFPNFALSEAIKYKDEIIPELLSIIENASKNINELPDDYFAHIYAMYLLAQFREKRAFPIIIDFFSHPGEISFEITGELVTEDLNRILASVYNDNIALLKSVIEDETKNEMIRSAFLETLVILAVNDMESRENILDYFYTLFTDRLEKTYSYTWTELISCCLALYPDKINQDQIKIAYEEDLVNISAIGHLEDIENEIAEGKEKALSNTNNNPHFSLITDTIAEMKWWACFKDISKIKQKDNERQNQIQNEKRRRKQKKKQRKQKRKSRKNNK